MVCFRFARFRFLDIEGSISSTIPIAMLSSPVVECGGYITHSKVVRDWEFFGSLIGISGNFWDSLGSFFVFVLFFVCFLLGG